MENKDWFNHLNEIATQILADFGTLQSKKSFESPVSLAQDGLPVCPQKATPSLEFRPKVKKISGSLEFIYVLESTGI